MNFLDNEEFEKYLEHKTCRGCSNRCLLVDPNCNRSKIFIEDEYEKFVKERKI